MATRNSLRGAAGGARDCLVPASAQQQPVVRLSRTCLHNEPCCRRGGSRVGHWLPGRHMPRTTRRPAQRRPSNQGPAPTASRAAAPRPPQLPRSPSCCEAATCGCATAHAQAVQPGAMLACHGENPVGQSEQTGAAGWQQSRLGQPEAAELTSSAGRRERRPPAGALQPAAPAVPSLRLALLYGCLRPWAPWARKGSSCAVGLSLSGRSRLSFAQSAVFDAAACCKAHPSHSCAAAAAARVLRAHARSARSVPACFQN